MEWLKKLTALLFVLTIVFSADAKGLPLPDDIPTIEALISAHKRIAKAENVALRELSGLETEHYSTKEFMNDCKKARDYLNQRLADVHSSLILGTRVLKVTIQIKNIIENYKEFVSLTFDNVDKHPFLAAYFATANATIAMESKLLYERIIQFSAAYETNVMKSTMKEKEQLLNIVETSIGKLNFMLWNANLTCRNIAIDGLHDYDIQEYLHNGTNKKIMDKIIAKWKKENTKKQN